MISVDAYLDSVVSGVGVLAPIELPLSSAHGCVLAHDIRAPWPLPPFDCAAFDGYAVSNADLASTRNRSVVQVDVVDDVPAGFRSTEKVGRGRAVRVMTGAPIPEGADAVVRLLPESANGDVIELRSPIDVGTGIRQAGEDIVAGEVALVAGTLIGSREIAMLAALGCGLVHVHPRPRVAVISIGSELMEPGLALRVGLVNDVNSHVLVAAAREAGADAYRVGPIGDDPDELREAIEDQLHRADLVITTGGLSGGAHDIVAEVIAELGAVDVVSVAMDPGDRQGHGRVGDEGIQLIALPGDSVSAWVSFELFVRPVLRRMLGLPDDSRAGAHVTCAEPIESPVELRQFVRARYVSPGLVVPVGSSQGGHILAGLTQAEVLLVIPEGVREVRAGDRVDVLEV